MARQALPLVDRLMAMVEGVNPLHVLYLVELSACPDPAALEAALRDLVLGEALLSSCLRDAFWGPQRWDWSPEEGGWPQLVQVADVGDEGALMRFRAWPLPLADGPPLRLLLRPERDGRCLLVLKLHHSASDATGAFGLLRRLAQSLSLAGPGQVAVTPKPPPGSPFWRLTWAARFRVLWAGSSELMKGFRQGGQGFATLFPLPAEGPSRHLALRLGPHEVEALRARAHVLGASLNELLMATLLHQLVQSLPSHQAELPWVTHMAVGLREAGDEALGNRVADVRLVFDAKALLLGPASALKAVVAACAPARRDRSLAIARLFERWMVSRVPLSAFRRLLTGVMRGPKNQAMSLDWSNLGDAGPVPGPFGLARGEAAYFLPPLCTPPGVGVAVATLGGHLHLVLSYAEGPVTEAQAKRWMEGVGQALRQAAQAGQDGL